MPLLRRYKENCLPKCARKVTGLSKNEPLVLLTTRSKRYSLWLNFKESFSYQSKILA